MKTTAFDLQLDPSSPRMRLHRITRSRDPDFWAIKATLDLRIVVHKTDQTLLLCYVDHHDAAYRWAASRKIERHPHTGAAQLVEIHERKDDSPMPKHIETPTPARPETVPPLADFADEDLLCYGVPPDWLDTVRAASEDQLLEVAQRLPREAAEALIELATGGKPPPPHITPVDSDPFHHPDARRRFRAMEGNAELQRALDYPWEQWALFLHPAQRALVEADYGGAVKITGAAGTGKTVVALHRAVHIARRDPDARVLMTTFWRNLADASARKLDRLVGNEPAHRHRIVARALGDLCGELYAERFGAPTIATGAVQRDLISDAAGAKSGLRICLAALMDEWDGVVQAYHVRSWPAYREAPLPAEESAIRPDDRERVWPVFAGVLQALQDRGLVTISQMFGRLTAELGDGSPLPFTHLVVDESQDLGIAELRFLAAMGRARADSLFLVGDLGQRIFRQPVSWAAHGIDVRGRTHSLRINYRCTYQIQQRTDRLLPGILHDPDGFHDIRDNTLSILNGGSPVVTTCPDAKAEIATVADWLRGLATDVQPHEIAVFVRAAEQLPRARAALKAAGLPATELTDTAEPAPGTASIAPMHLAKGLEFKAVAVMACDEDALPLKSRIDTVRGVSDIEDVYTTERHLLYVACTRARDHLMVTGVSPGSEFLSPMRDNGSAGAAAGPPAT